MALKNDWHMDKKVPLALAFALLVQAATIVWWAAGMEHRMTYAEQAVGQVRADHAQLQDDLDGQATRVAVLVEQLANTNRGLETLRTDVKETNVLLRDLITKVSGGMRP